MKIRILWGMCMVDLADLKDNNAVKKWLGCAYDAVEDDDIINRIIKLVEETGADYKDISFEDERIMELFKVNEYKKCAPGSVDLPEFRGEHVQKEIVKRRPESFDDLTDILMDLHTCAPEDRDCIRTLMTLIWLLAWFKVYYPEEYRVNVDDFEAFRVHMVPGYSRVQTEILFKYVRNDKVREKLDRTYLDVTELLRIIDNGYVDIHAKLESIRMMKLELEYLKTKHPTRSLGPRDGRGYNPDVYVIAMEKLYAKTIDLLSGKKQRSIFTAQYAWIAKSDSNSHIEDALDIEKESEFAVFDSFEEVKNYLKEYHDPEEGIEELNIDVITVPENAPHAEPLYVVIHYDGKDINIFHQYYKDNGKCLGLSDEEAELVGEITDNSDVRYEKLPYDYGSYIKVKLPLMKEPYIGQLYMHMDYFHNWYSFLYDIDEFCEGDFIDLSYHSMNCSILDYATWDWISEASNEEVEEFRRKRREVSI